MTKYLVTRRIQSIWCGSIQEVYLIQIQINLKKQQRIPKLTVNGQEITNDQDIAYTMNIYFCTISPSLASILPMEDKNLNDFMVNKIDETICLSPTSEQEIEKEIQNIIQ